jgi:hypothetical protein
VSKQPSEVTLDVPQRRDSLDGLEFENVHGSVAVSHQDDEIENAHHVCPN